MESNSDAAQYQYMGTYVRSMPTPAALPSSCSSLRLPLPSTHFHIPPLHSSFPSLLHPDHELVKEQCDGWILHVAQPPSAAACRLLLECVLPRLICRAIPASSSVMRLIHVTKIIAWITIADDDDDHPDALGADDATSAQHARRVLAILRRREDGNETAKNEPMLVFRSPTDDDDDDDDDAAVSCRIHFGGDSVGLMIDSALPHYASCNKSEKRGVALEALTELWAEMQRTMTPGLRDRFVLAMEDYFHAVKVQATFRKLHRLPDIEAYLEIRRQASFILPSFALLEYALGIELDKEAYSNPLVEKFRNLALDYMCLCNDLISCKVEIGVGDYFNMPSIVYSSSANKEWSFQDAINHVANMIKDLDEQCVSMLSVIQQSSSPSLQYPYVNTYIAALCSCMSGSLAWFLETARYRNTGGS